MGDPTTKMEKRRTRDESPDKNPNKRIRSSSTDGEQEGSDAAGSDGGDPGPKKWVGSGTAISECIRFQC